MRWLTRFALKFVIGFIAASVALVVLFKFVPVPVTATMLMDPHGFTRDWEPLSQVDRNLVRAAIAGEDSTFCRHDGFDRAAIEKAVEHNFAVREDGRGHIRGGSTISQQTAKNVFLWQGGGYVRKGLEAWFTFLIEHIWGKRRIMEVYLNVAETGIGTYGAEAGAKRYFNHSAAHLTPLEAARMVAAFPLPKERRVADPRGWLRRHGNTLASRVGVVRRDALDACVYP